MKIVYAGLFYILISLINCNKNSTNYFDWGLDNGIKLMKAIEISSEKGINKFIASENIEKNDEILKIPYELTFNIGLILDLMNKKELISQYELFKKLDIMTYEPHHINLQKEEIFLSYILYLIQHEPELYQNTKFCQKYKLYLESLNNYLPRSPLFYNSDQIEYLSGTYLGKFHDRIKKIFQEEIKVLKNESFYGKDIDFKDYVYERLRTQNKGLEIMGHISMIPFLNYFDRDYMTHNAKFTIEKNGDIKIIARRSIRKGNVIVVNSPRRTNVEKMLFEGQLNTYLVNYKENYIIPAFSPGLFYNYDLDDLDLYNNYIINLVELNFDEKAINLYKNYSQIFKGNGTDIWAYSILLENVEYYKDYVQNFIKDRINKIFDDYYDRKHVERAMKGEEKLLTKSSEYIRKKLEQLKTIEIESKQDKNKNTDL